MIRTDTILDDLVHSSPVVFGATSSSLSIRCRGTDG